MHLYFAFPAQLARLQSPIILDHAGNQRGLRDYAPRQTSVGLGYWAQKQDHHPWNIPRQAQKPLGTTIFKEMPAGAIETTQNQQKVVTATTLGDLPPEILHYIIEAFLPSLIDQWSLMHTSTWLKAHVQDIYQNYSWELLPCLYTQGSELEALRNKKFFDKRGMNMSMRTVRAWSYFSQTEIFPLTFKRYNRQGDVTHTEDLTFSVAYKDFGHKDHPTSEITLNLKQPGDPRVVRLNGLLCQSKFFVRNLNPKMGVNLGFLTKGLLTCAVSRLFTLNKDTGARMNRNMNLALLDVVYSDPDQNVRALPLYYQVLMSDIFSHAFYKMVRPEEPRA